MINYEIAIAKSEQELEIIFGPFAPSRTEIIPQSLGKVEKIAVEHPIENQLIAFSNSSKKFDISSRSSTDCLISLVVNDIRQYFYNVELDFAITNVALLLIQFEFLNFAV